MYYLIEYSGTPKLHEIIENIRLNMEEKPQLEELRTPPKLKPKPKPTKAIKRDIDDLGEAKEDKIIKKNRHQVVVENNNQDSIIDLTEEDANNQRNIIDLTKDETPVYEDNYYDEDNYNYEFSGGFSPIDDEEKEKEDDQEDDTA